MPPGGNWRVGRRRLEFQEVVVDPWQVVASAIAIETALSDVYLNGLFLTPRSNQLSDLTRIWTLFQFTVWCVDCAYM